MSETAWPADAVERRQVASLIPYARNARTHSEEQVAQLAASIREWGWTIPVLIDEDEGLIAGHGRVLAARLLGITEIPVVVARGWTEAQKRAYVLADNKLTLNAGWDNELLRVELLDLQAFDFDLGLAGFSESEIITLTAERTQGLTDPDAVPDEPADPIAVLGDVWTLGRHRLVCGDCTDADTVATCLNGVTPHLMVTDPPYGVKYDPAWRVGLHRTKRDGSALDAPAYAATGLVANDGTSDWREAWALFPGDVIYCWSSGLQQALTFEALIASGFEPRCQIIWRKPHFAIGRGDYHWQHEPCWYAVRQGKTGHWQGDRKQTSVWDITSGVGFTTQKEGKDARTGHGTQKPVECMKRPIENNSSAGQAVYEPFNGSGTTIIAGEITGRAIHAIELNPAYVDVAIIRWQEFTGLQAVHADGRMFDDIRAGERAQPEPAVATPKAAPRRATGRTQGRKGRVAAKGGNARKGPVRPARAASGAIAEAV